MRSSLQTALWIVILAALPFQMQGQYSRRLPKPITVAKVHRPIDLKVQVRQVEQFYQRLFDEQISLSEIKLAKTDQAYYLLAEQAGGPLIFAFELKQRGKRVCLEPLLPVHSCDRGDLSIRTFLEVDGKIGGCRLGAHNVRQIQLVD